MRNCCDFQLAIKNKAARIRLAAEFRGARTERHSVSAPDAAKPPLHDTSYLLVRLADTTRMIASPDGPTFKVPTITGSPSLMLMSVSKPVFS